MRLDYRVVPSGWATFSLINPSPRDWSGKSGVVFYLRAQKTGQNLVVGAYGGKTPDNLEPFEFTLTTTRAEADGWVKVTVAWEDFAQPRWAGDGTARFDPGRAMGLAFVFSPDEPGEAQGAVWIDDFGWLP